MEVFFYLFQQNSLIYRRVLRSPEKPLFSPVFPVLDLTFFVLCDKILNVIEYVGIAFLALTRYVVKD